MNLVSLADDILISILSFIEPFDLLAARKTCKRLYALTKLRIVWTNACLRFILGRSCPFPSVSLDSLSVEDLEGHTCHSDLLAKKWASQCWNPSRMWSTATTAHTSVTDVRIVPGSQGKLLFTLSKSIWSAITLWELEPVITRTESSDCAFIKRCEWSPRGAIFSGFTLNSDPTSEVKMAISVLNNGVQTVELLSLTQGLDEWSLEPMVSIPSTYRPITLEGDFLAMGDDICEIIIYNWRTNTYATLESSSEMEGISQYDHCIQVVFTPQSILVNRARSLHLFPLPQLKPQEDEPQRYSPIARHSFGWLDSVSVQIMNRPTEPHALFESSQEKFPQRPLSILIRAETDDPWSSDVLSMELYTLYPNPDYNSSDPEAASPEASDRDMTSLPTPYIFPPVLTSEVSSRRGALRCRDIVLGKCGTALWVQPRDRAATGLYWTSDDDPLPVGPQTIVRSDYKHESLVATVFPGSLFPGVDDDNPSSLLINGHVDGRKPEGKVICWNEQHNWSSIDYDEDVGRIVLGTSFGRITILDM